MKSIKLFILKYLNSSLFLFFFFIVKSTYSQCDPSEIVICDMTIIDGDGDTVPDGILNLTDAYNALPSTTVPIVTGTWYDPGFNYALDEVTGELHIWDLDESSEAATTYVFELTRPECPDPVLVNLIVGPFSGTVSANDPNIQICSIEYRMCGSAEEDDGFNLDQVLDPLPSAHSNGVWEYVGSSPGVIVYGSFFTACVLYEPGPPLTDEETFEFLYKVPGVSPCALEMTTRVTVSVVRDVVSGESEATHICEQDLQDGVYNNVNLRDDLYLIKEDEEGTWDDTDGTGQIANPGDSIVNLGQVYNDLYASNQRFGCQVYTYTYGVDDRSNVCTDQSTGVSFKFYEKIRPFQQTVPPPEFCAGDPSLTTFDLYSLFEFQVENGVLYDYPNRSCTNWKIKSTTAPNKTSLGLVSNSGDLCIISPFDLAFYNTEGRINLSDLTNNQVGTYVFEYTVLADYTCDIGGEYASPLPPCDDYTGEAIIKIKKYNYAGDDTTNIDYCEDNTVLTVPLDLFTLLDTNKTDTIYKGTGAVWKDNINNVEVTNPVTLPQINGKQSFDYTYTTPPSTWGCADQANLKFTVYEKYEPGTLNVPNPYSVCNTQAPFNLFDVLTDADTNGVWTLPNNSKTGDNNYTFDPEISPSGTYIYTVPDNEVNKVCPSSSTSLTISVIQNLDPGVPYPNPQVICIYDELTFNLFAFIDGNPSKTGVFTNDPANAVDISGAISGNDLDTKLIPEAGYYQIIYTVQAPSCPPASTLIKLDIKGLADAGVSAQKNVCRDAVPLDLFNELTGTPDATGRWLDVKDNEISPNNTFIFNPSSVSPGAYIFKYEVSGIAPCDKITISTVTMDVFEIPNPGINISKSLCRSSGVVDLEDYLEKGADLGGVFVDVDGSGALSGSNLDLNLLAEQSYRFTYTVSNPGCTSLPIEMQITPIVLKIPVIEPQTFCIADGKTLADIKVPTSLNYIWYDSLTSTSPLLESTILSLGEEYYVATADDDGCESDRTNFKPNLLPVNDKKCDPCIPEAVSPNGDGVNDVLDLCALPYVFPKYIFKIFNRYGTVVFNGGYNKPEFNGSSNVSLAFGEQLASGIYFYIFDPQDGKTKPFQGNFYLSR